MLKSGTKPFEQYKNRPYFFLERLLIICGIKHNNFSCVDSVEKWMLKSKNFVEKFSLNLQFLFPFPVKMPVSEIQAGVYGNHKQVYYIKVQNNIIAVEYFVYNPAHITYEDCPLKCKASACCSAAFKGFVDFKRPCKPEAYKHACFKNTHNR